MNPQRTKAKKRSLPITLKEQPTEPVRINKYLASQGVASRREADVLIESGKILVNGTPAKLGQLVDAGDEVRLLGQTKDKKYFAYYKGRGIISHSPAAHETDIATRLKNDYGLTDVFPIGRLDKDSEGLMILTNDGRLTGPLLNPKSDHEKEYEVTLDKNVTGHFLKMIERGVKIERYTTKPAKATLSPSNSLKCTIVLTEGKKHQIRRMCAALGYQVTALKRVRIMNVTLGKLKPNQYRTLTPNEITTLINTLLIRS